jgi:hypothetical protein
MKIDLEQVDKHLAEARALLRLGENALEGGELSLNPSFVAQVERLKRSIHMLEQMKEMFFHTDIGDFANEFLQ